MPFTDEQIEALRSADPEQQKRVVSQLSQDARVDLAESIKAYDSKKSGASQQGATQEKSLWQKVKDVPISPAGWAISRAGVTNAFNPTIGNLLQGGKRAYEAIAQGHLKVPTAVQEVVPYTGPLVSAAKGIARLAGTDIDTVKANAYSKLTDYIKASEESYKASNRPNLVGEALGGMLAVPIPGASSGGNIAARLGKTFAQGFAESAATSPTENREDNFYIDRLKSGAVGATVGTALHGLGAGVIGLSRKARELAAGTKLGRLFIKTIDNPEYAGARDLMKDFEAEGVRPDTASITGNPVLISQSKDIHRKDPKYMKWLVDQAKEAGRSLQGFVDDIHTAVKSERWNNIDDVRRVAETPGARRQESAKRLLDAINNSSDDVKEMVQSGGNLNLMLAKLRSDANFDKLSALDNAIRQSKMAKAEAIAEQSNAAARLTHKEELGSLKAEHEYNLSNKKKAWEFDITNLRRDAEEANAALQSRLADIAERESMSLDKAPFQQLKQDAINKHKSTIESIQKQIDDVNKTRGAEVDVLTKEGQSKIDAFDKSFKEVKPSMRDVADVPATDFVRTLLKESKEVDSPTVSKILSNMKDGSIDMSFNGLRKMRTEINREISALRGDLAASSKTAIPALERLQKSLEKHIMDYAEAAGPVFKNQYRKALAEYKRDVVPFMKPNINKALGADNPEAIIGIFEGKNIYDKRKAWNLLPEKGKQAVVASLLDKSLKAAEFTPIGSSGIDFKPTQAANELEKLVKNDTINLIGESYPGVKQRAVRIQKILRSISSSNAGFMPQTGVVNQSFTKDKSVSKALDYSVNWLNRSMIKKMLMDPGSNGLLVLASSVKPGSNEFKNAMGRLAARYAGRASATELATTDSEQLLNTNDTEIQE